MCGLYKLLAKVLANRLKKVMGKEISKFKNAFMEVRQILNAVLIANDTIDFMLTKIPVELCVILTLKRHDHINWAFLLYILEKMDFD